MQSNKPKELAKRIVYEGQKLQLIEIDMEFPSGHQEIWEYVELKGFGGAKVLALTDDDYLLLVREYRGAAGQYVLRVPTGSIEENETSEEAAKRELLEEVGYFPHKLELIEVMKSKSTFFKAKAYLFLATNLEEKHVRRDPGEDTMETVKIPLEKAYQMIEDLEIEEPQTIYAILRLRKYLREKKL